jgi:hypothetical protein
MSVPFQKHHSRTGKLDKPESCHDQARASFLNTMQAPPRSNVDLQMTSGSVLVLMRLAASRSGKLTTKVLMNNVCGVVNRADVAVLVERGFAEERKAGLEITDAGNDLVRALVVLADGFGPKARDPVSLAALPLKKGGVA